MIELINTECLAALDLIPSNSIDCVVTSPPYWGLRSYGEISGMIGLEPSLAEHLGALVTVFREVRRVLKPTGTCWVNYGDAYACAPNGRSAADTKAVGNDDRRFCDKPLNTVGPICRVDAEASDRRGQSGNKGAGDGSRARIEAGGTLKPKDRMMLPARLAMALQEDGWWLRDEIVWHKPNPMPSSVKDRSTPAHEMLYLLTKRPKYCFDQAAWMEPAAEPNRQRNDRIGGVNGHLVRHSPGGMIGASATRNKRSVWTIAPKPFKEAHFATFPPGLIEPCILAGCPVGGLVLDPFAGAGTTGLVARQHGRSAILIEISPDYCAIARRRLDGEPIAVIADKQQQLGRQAAGFNAHWKSAKALGIFA